MAEGEDKVMCAIRKILDSIEAWLKDKPTGQFKANIEVNANQGGVADVFIDVQKREKV